MKFPRGNFTGKVVGEAGFTVKLYVSPGKPCQEKALVGWSFPEEISGLGWLLRRDFTVKPHCTYPRGDEVSPGKLDLGMA